MMMFILFKLLKGIKIIWVNTLLMETSTIYKLYRKDRYSYDVLGKTLLFFTIEDAKDYVAGEFSYDDTVEWIVPGVDNPLWIGLASVGLNPLEIYDYFIEPVTIRGTFSQSR